MSTTVNVKVDKGQLSQQLKDQAAQSRFEAEKEGTSTNPSREERQQQEAVDEAVRQVLGIQGDDGQLKLKKRRRQLAANRQQLGQRRAEDQLADGVVPLARVTIRSNGIKYLISPWGVEAALGRRLSSNYSTAKQEASFLGVEIDFTKESLPELPPEPVGQKGGGPFVGYAGFSYDRTPYTFALFRTAQFFTRIDGRYTTDITGLTAACVLDAKNTIAQKYDFLITKQINFGTSSNCYYFAGYNADDAADGGTFTDKAFQDIYVSTGAGPSRSTYEILLPVGDQKVLVVLVHRNLLEFAHLRAFWQTEGLSRVIKASSPTSFFGLFSVERVETDVSYEGVLDTSKMSVNLDGALTNEVRCVLVTNTSATEVQPSEQLVAACDLLIERLDASKATADLETSPLITKTSFANLETTSRTRAPYKYKGFEASNLPKAPYYETPTDQQVLAKQFGIGYLGTTNHAGNFITPAIFDWLTKQPTLNTSYAPHITRYQASFNNDSKPFPGFYLDVPAAGFEGEVMTAILATPQDINTKVTATAEQSIQVETQSTFGDYLVWDWGNPEYCRERLTQLGMGFLF